MTVQLTEKSGGKVLEVRVSGKLAHGDYQRFVPEFERSVKKTGRIRVLFDMTDFHGWKTAALWDDVIFDLEHFAAIERLAMVGTRKWQKWMSRVCRPFSTASIRYFDRAGISQARAWLEDDTNSADSARTPILRVFQSRDQTRAFYNKISRFYDLLSDRSEAPVRKSGLDLLKPMAGERILEIGFGTGQNLVPLARAVGSEGKVFGLDLSDQMILTARKKLARAGLPNHAQLRRGDATQLPYTTGMMDAVLMSFTLELFDTPEIPIVLSECKRVLRNGGRIVVVAMSKAGERERLVGVFEWAHKHYPNFIDCRPIYAREALEMAGFKIQRTVKKQMWIPVEIIRGLKS